jgi:hypothetical protein
VRLDREGDRDMVIVHPSEMYIRSMHHGSIGLDLRPRSARSRVPRLAARYIFDRAGARYPDSLRSRALLLALDRLQETEPEL